LKEKKMGMLKTKNTITEIINNFNRVMNRENTSRKESMNLNKCKEKCNVRGK
jgi:predicted methyltransferase